MGINVKQAALDNEAESTHRNDLHHGVRTNFTDRLTAPDEMEIVQKIDQQVHRIYTTQESKRSPLNGDQDWERQSFQRSQIKKENE